MFFFLNSGQFTNASIARRSGGGAGKGQAANPGQKSVKTRSGYERRRRGRVNPRVGAQLKTARDIKWPKFERVSPPARTCCRRRRTRVECGLPAAAILPLHATKINRPSFARGRGERGGGDSSVWAAPRVYI